VLCLRSRKAFLFAAEQSPLATLVRIQPISLAEGDLVGFRRAFDRVVKAGLYCNGGEHRGPGFHSRTRPQ